MTNRHSSRIPSCPVCEQEMQRRQNRSSGYMFWGCSRFPNCRGTRAFVRDDDGVQDIMDYVFGEDDTPGAGDFDEDGSSEAKWYRGDDDPDYDPWKD